MRLLLDRFGLASGTLYAILTVMAWFVAPFAVLLFSYLVRQFWAPDRRCECKSRHEYLSRQLGTASDGR